MIEGKTASGFEYKITEDALDDYDLLEALTDIDSGNYQKITVVVDHLLGKEQKEMLKKHIRENGRVSAKAMISEIFEILKGSQTGKNS